MLLQIGILPYAGTDIALFEMFKDELLQRYDGNPPHIAILGAGMLSSVVAQFVSYPLALIRTRLQVNTHCMNAAGGCVCATLVSSVDMPLTACTSTMLCCMRSTCLSVMSCRHSLPSLFMYLKFSLVLLMCARALFTAMYLHGCFVAYVGSGCWRQSHQIPWYD